MRALRSFLGPRGLFHPCDSRSSVIRIVPVQQRMIRRRQELQIFRTIVGLIVVNVVDLFFRCQHAAEFIRHDKAVLKNVVVRIGHRMSGYFNQNVSFPHGPTTLPVRVVGPTFHWPHLLSKLLRFLSAAFRCPILLNELLPCCSFRVAPRFTQELVCLDRSSLWRTTTRAVCRLHLRAVLGVIPQFTYLVSHLLPIGRIGTLGSLLGSIFRITPHYSGCAPAASLPQRTVSTINAFQPDFDLGLFGLQCVLGGSLRPEFWVLPDRSPDTRSASVSPLSWCSTVQANSHVDQSPVALSRV